MDIQRWIDEKCVVGSGANSRISDLWFSFDRWLWEQTDKTPHLVDGKWPKQKDLRQALLDAGFIRGGYKSTPLFVGIQVKHWIDDNRWTT